MARRDAARLLIPLTVAVITAAVYAPTLNFAFVLDDHKQIVLGRGRFTFENIPSFFTGDVWRQILPEKTNYYRPVFLIWLLVNYRLFGADPLLWHLSSVAVHVVAALLLYFLARKLTGDSILAGIAAVLFGVHPVNVEAVAWISGVTEPLLAVFFVGAVLCHLAWREQDDRRSRLFWRAGALCLLALALLEKETAIALPALFFAHEWLSRDRKGAVSALLRTIPYWAVTAVYLAVRSAALGGLMPRPGGWSLSAMIWTWPSVLLFYARQLVWPFHHSIYYGIDRVLRPGLREFILPAIAVGLPAVVLHRIARRSGAAAFFALMLVTPLLPVLNFQAFPPDDFVHDRYLYAPSAGFRTLLELGLRRLPSVRVQAAIGLPLAALLAFLTVRGSRFWTDGLKLTTHAVHAAPDSPMARQIQGVV